MAWPLTQLTHKDVPFDFGQQQRDAFATLKHLVTSAPCLRIPDCTLDDSFELHTDASAKALSGVLYQKVQSQLRPCAFHSRRLNKAEENYSATDRELLAIVDSLRAFRHYLHGLQFVVRTDHAPLQYYFTQPNLSGRVLYWEFIIVIMLDFYMFLYLFIIFIIKGGCWLLFLWELSP